MDFVTAVSLSIPLFFVLFLVLERLDEGLLGQILRVMNVPDHTVNLPENAPQMLGDEGLLQFHGQAARLEQRPALPVVVRLRRIGLFHAKLQRKSCHSLPKMTLEVARRGKELTRYPQL